MQATVIDTLRYANRLKDAGVEAVQAEAMAFAINDELVSGLATKADIDRAASGLRTDLDQAVGALRDELRGEIGELRDQLRGEIGDLREELREELRGEIGELREELRGEIGELREEVRNETGSLRSELGALSGKFETHARHVFLVLAIIAALGLFNAVAPHLGRTPATVQPPADVSAPPSDSVSSSPG